MCIQIVIRTSTNLPIMSKQSWKLHQSLLVHFFGVIHLNKCILFRLTCWCWRYSWEVCDISMSVIGCKFAGLISIVWEANMTFNSYLDISLIQWGIFVTIYIYIYRERERDRERDISNFGNECHFGFPHSNASQLTTAMTNAILQCWPTNGHVGLIIYFSYVPLEFGLRPHVLTVFVNPLGTNWKGNIRLWIWSQNLRSVLSTLRVLWADKPPQGWIRHTVGSGSVMYSFEIFYAMKLQ